MMYTGQSNVNGQFFIIRGKMEGKQVAVVMSDFF